MKIHIFHEWRKWSKPQEAEWSWRQSQFRECKVCGRRQQRKVKINV